MVEDNKNKDNGASRDTAKSKIILFVIGVLLGAVISTSSLLIGINIAGNRPTNPPTQLQPGFSSNMPGGQNGDQRKQMELPQKNQNNQDNNQPKSPEKPNSQNDNNQKPQQ